MKNYKYSVWFKLFAIVLCTAGMISIAFGVTKAPYFDIALQNTDFKESIELKNIFSDAYKHVSNVAFNYKSEENIRTNYVVDENYIRDRKHQILNDREIAIQEITDKYTSLIQQRNDNWNINNTEVIEVPHISEENSNIENDGYDVSKTYTTPSNPQANEYNKLLTTLVQERDQEVQAVIEKYNASINNIKSDYIDERVMDYYREIGNLKKLDGIHYTVVDNNKITFSNMPSSSSESTNTFYIKHEAYLILTSENINSTYPINYYYDTSNFPENSVVYLGITPAKYRKELAVYNQNYSDGRLGLTLLLIGLAAFLIGFIYIIYASGRRVNKDGIHLIFADYIHLDAAFVLSSIAIILCIIQAYYFYNYFIIGMTHINSSLLLIGFALIIALGTLIGILFVTIFSKRAKRHDVISHTITYKICIWSISKSKKLISKMGSVYDASPIAIRLVFIFGTYGFLTIVGILLFLTGSLGIFLGFIGIIGINVVAFYYILKYYKILKTIYEGAEKIRSGELSYNIPQEGIPEFRQLSATINSIADGLKSAVSNQVKSERMKAELITNVSHDLKTPLTSIITYVDLMKSEGLHSENAEKYLGIIDNKSQRLKALTEDLFEAAKASSGSIAVNLEKLDAVSLITQGLGELSDKIEESGLNFKTNMPTSKLLVYADGKLLWRVIENLLSNVFKYALPNSRVYIDAFSTADNVKIVIKNISAYELNINEEELMERFKRGDASRHSEGSGLGLSIAKSLTELQGGSFHIEIDGDLFKATIEMPVCY